MTAPDPLLRRRRRVAALFTGLFATVLLVVVASILVGPRLRSPQQVAAEAAPPPASPVTARATRRALVEPVVLRGRIRPGKSVKVAAPAAATGPDSVVTGVRVDSGDRLREGRVLLEVAGRPMIALDLAFPLYRDVTAGVTGPDVAELQRALRRLGYRVPITETFDAATQEQVRRFYTDRGYAREAVAAVAVPQGSVLVTGRIGQRITRVGVKVGHTLTDPAKTLLELNGASPTVVAVADKDQAALLRAGQTATATDDLTGRKATTTITSVSDEPVTDEAGQNGFQVHFAFRGKAIGGGTNRSLQMDVQVGAGTGKVLAVPVTALYSRPDGSTFVSVLPPGGRPVDVTVTTGQIAGGWVEITDPDDPRLADGADVVIGEQATD